MNNKINKEELKKILLSVDIEKIKKIITNIHHEDILYIINEDENSIKK